MEGLRGLAVGLVFFVHYDSLLAFVCTPESATRAISRFLGTIGHAGVDLFFVLSGYLIYGTLIARPKPFAPYLRRRVERIYPAFLVVFAVYLVLSWAVPAKSRIPEDPAAAAIYLLQNLLLLPGMFPLQPMITVAWSLSYEFFFYLLVPALIAAFSLRRRSPRWRAISTFVAAVVCMALALAGEFARVRLVFFAAGIVIFEILQYSVVAVRTSRALDLGAAIALAAALLALHALYNVEAPFAQWPESEVVRSALPFVLLFPAHFAFVLACFLPGSLLGASMCWTPLRWLGNMSYSFYLVHGLALHPISMATHRATGLVGSGDWLYWALLPVSFAAACGLSLLVFAAVERPFSLVPGGRKRTA